MERSEQIGELIAALAKAQQEFTPAFKSSDNPFFNSKYADLAANIDAVRPALNRHGIALIQFDTSDIGRQAGIVTTSLHHGEQFIAVTAEAPAAGQKGFNVQSLGACWTYLRRYTLQALCGLASEDDDGNSFADDPKKLEVYAEVARQAGKKAKVVTEMPQPEVPPELDWSYNKASGVLICRVVDVKVAKTQGAKPKEYVAVKINQQIDGKDMAFYWHESHKAELLAAKGKICKFLTLFTDKGFLNIDMVTEIDGLQVQTMAGNTTEENENQARLLGSVLDFDDEDLREVHAHHNGDWAKVVAHLKDLKQRKDEGSAAV